MITAYTLLFEIGCEEIPSRFIPGALEQLKKAAAELLTDYRLKHEKVEAWGTPRRLTLKVAELEESQPDMLEQIKGPLLTGPMMNRRTRPRLCWALSRGTASIWKRCARKS